METGMAPEAMKLVAVRDITIRGKSYKRGEAVDLTGLLPSKISQLLDQRRLLPADNLITTKK